MASLSGHGDVPDAETPLHVVAIALDDRDRLLLGKITECHQASAGENFPFVCLGVV